MSMQSHEQDGVGADAELSHARRLETIGAFASGIAHNFNNIVTAIVGRAEMALDEVAPDSAAADSLRENPAGGRAGARAGRPGPALRPPLGRASPRDLASRTSSPRRGR